MTKEKQLYMIIFALAIALASVSSCLFALTHYGQHAYSQSNVPTIVAGQEQETQLRTIAVTGSGRAAAKPNLADLRLGVSTQASNATEALAKNAEFMNQIIETLKAMGIPEEDIETIRFGLYPRYRYGHLVGFEVTHMLKITTTDLDGVGQIIDKAVEAGANRVETVRFTFVKDKLDELNTLARQRAIEDAKTKAKTIADSLGVKIVGVAKAEEAYYYRPHYPMVLEARAAVITPPTPIMPPTEVEVIITVKVVFIIE
jgi:hypothetical protein